MITALSQPLSINRQGPLFESPSFRDTKDPCTVFDGTKWHLYGSGGSSEVENWQILHAVSDSKFGPWEDLGPATLEGLTGSHVAAPGVVKDLGEQLFHMFIQTDFLDLGGKIIHLTSVDGHFFKILDTPIDSMPGTDEAGIYDPHPAEINGEKYITYSATDKYTEFGAAQPNIHLAKSLSGTWFGPWERLGAILTHEDVVSHHNQRGHDDYEWGLEGPQLIQLAPDLVLLCAVCFLPSGARGTRQRVFFSVANNPKGPFLSLGPILQPEENDWGAGETGHASGFVDEGKLNLFYQARNPESPWKYGLATLELPEIETACRKLLLA